MVKDSSEHNVEDIAGDDGCQREEAPVECCVLEAPNLKDEAGRNAKEAPVHETCGKRGAQQTLDIVDGIGQRQGKLRAKSQDSDRQQQPYAQPCRGHMRDKDVGQEADNDATRSISDADGRYLVSLLLLDHGVRVVFAQSICKGIQSGSARARNDSYGTLGSVDRNAA